MWTLLKVLPLSTEEPSNPFSFGDQFDGGSSLDPFDPTAAQAFNSPFASFANTWGLTTSETSQNAGSAAVDPIFDQTFASAAPSTAIAPAATKKPAAVADLQVGGVGLIFKNSFDSSCSAQFEACVVAAEETLEGLFTNPIVLNVSFSEQAQGDTGDAASNSAAYDIAVPYSTLKNALPSSDVLPATVPAAYSEVLLPEAYARMLGLSSATPSTDASVLLNTSAFGTTFGQDVTDTITHELTENLMGRVGGLQDQDASLFNAGVDGPMDFFRYAAGGTSPDYSDGRDGKTTYFSSNGGKTTSQSVGLSFNNEFNSSGNRVNNGDTADFTQQAVFGYENAGETLTLTQTELNIMQALGWKTQISEDFFTGSGNWQTATDWLSNVNLGATPIEPQDAYIGFGAAGAAASATSVNDIIVNSIGTNAASTLTIGGGSTLTATNGTVLNPSDVWMTASGNNGAITVDDYSTLSVGDIFNNVGSLTLGLVSTFENYAIFTNVGSLTVEDGGTFENNDLSINSGTMTVEGYRSAANLGGADSNNGSINVGVGAYVTVLGVFENSGAVSLGEQVDESPVTPNSSELVLSAPTTLSGGGVINMGQITIGWSNDVVGGGGGGGGGGHPVAYESSGLITDVNGLGSLVNNDNAISGAGIISVGALDNFSFTGIGASLAGYSLQIESGAISNEGLLFADAQTTLELGFDPSSGAVSLANTGQIVLAAGADLAIASNLTNSGAGFIDFTGAGAALTSDGAGAITFTSANKIVATASAQIGDAGLKSANDLSLIDTGSILAENAGVTLTLNTGANNVIDRGGLFEAEASAQLTIDSAVQTGQFVAPGETPPPQSTIEAGSGGVVNINATIFDGVNFANQINGQILIDGGTVNVAAGVSLDAPVNFTGTSGVLNLASTPVDVDVNGAGGAINLSHANADVTGGGFHVTEAGTDWLAIGGNGAGGAADIVNGSGETTTTHASSHVAIVGSHDTVNVGVGNALSLQGANDVLDLRQLFGDTTLSGFGASDVMDISNSDFADFQALLSHTTQSGANTLITLDAHDAIELTNVAASSLTASQFRFA